MKLKLIAIIIFANLGFTAIAAHANEVLLTANQPMKVNFRIAHKNENNLPVFGEAQTVNLKKNMSVPIFLENYEKAGIVILSLNDHVLPSSTNQFDQPNQCSMTTDKLRTTGALEFSVSSHAINCHTYGGKFR